MDVCILLTREESRIIKLHFLRRVCGHRVWKAMVAIDPGSTLESRMITRERRGRMQGNDSIESDIQCD